MQRASDQLPPDQAPPRAWQLTGETSRQHAAAATPTVTEEQYPSVAIASVGLMTLIAYISPSVEKTPHGGNKRINKRYRKRQRAHVWAGIY